MKVYVYKNEETLAKAAASLFVNLTLEKPDAIFGLATGSTPIPVYQELARQNKAGVVSFAKTRTYNLDEYANMAPDHEQSYRRFMNEQLFNHIDIDMANTHVPNGFAAADEAAAYDDEIEAAGGVDLQLLGIGHNGHIGFNEPDSDFSLTTHIVDLTPSTREANKRFFASIDEVPTQAISMGIGTIMKAKKIIMIATGEGKAKAVRDMVKGPVTPNMPASILAFHQNVVVMLDEAAASLL